MRSSSDCSVPASALTTCCQTEPISVRVAWQRVNSACMEGDLSALRLAVALLAPGSCHPDTHWSVVEHIAFYRQPALLAWFLASRTPPLGLAQGAHHAIGVDGKAEVLRLLLVQGAPMISFNGKSPLHRAAWLGNVAATRVLLAAGAYPDALDDNGLTALHWAARGGHVAVVACLLAVSNPYLLGEDGLAALDHAQHAGHREVIALLTPWAEHATLAEYCLPCNGSLAPVRL